MKKKQKPHTKKSKRYLLWTCVFFVASIAMGLLPYLLAGNSGLTETYTLKIYPVISRPLIFFTSLFPVSLTEISLLLLVLGLPAWFIFLFMTRKRNNNRWKKILLGASATIFTGTSLFTVMLGINYSRLPLQDLLFPQRQPRKIEELVEVAEWLAFSVSQARTEQQEDSKGVMRLSSELSRTLAQGNEAMDAAAEVFPELKGNAVRPKPVFLSRYWSYTGITGMYMPLLGEANINTDVPDSGLPHTICHEIAHVRGIAREQDANLAGFLACIYSSQPDYQYSGYQFAYSYFMSDLYRIDEETYFRIASMVPEEVRRDLQNQAEYWKEFEGPVQETSTIVNDAYLKANRQEDGVISYGKVTELIAEFYFSYVKGDDAP